MDCKNVGKTIAKLRRGCGMTQLELAERLGVSNKAVSKWENGQGYPDITLLPTLAEIFCVSIDYLIMGEAKGVTIAGNIIMDVVKSIGTYPERGMLVNISDIDASVGGCAPNTAIDLAKIDRRVPISVIGKVGTDENGRFIISKLQKHGINISKICYTSEHPTSFCDVMSVPSGERTFFYKSGANADFSPGDVDIQSLNCDIFHIGYILLLDKFDVLFQFFRKLVIRLHFADVAIPTLELLLYRFDFSFVFVWEFGCFHAVDFVCYCSLDGLHCVEHVGLHHNQLCDAVHHNCVFERYEVKPTATTLSSRSRAEFAANFCQQITCLVIEFCRERSTTHACAVCFENTENFSDFVWCYAQTGASSGTYCV